MMSRKRVKLDGNHAEIKSALKGIGVQVHDASAAGDGMPDLICFWRGQTVWIECKNDKMPPSKRALTAAQIWFHAGAKAAGVTIHVCKTPAEALAIFGARESA